jgi:dihydrolipoamide dehydrogenase
MSAENLACDVVVLGAGTAGLAAERAARKAGARTRLIDPEFRGTLCANSGCMPSKLLIAAAHAAHAVRQAPVFGVHPGSLQVDGPAVMARVHKERDRFVDLTRQGFDDLPLGTAVTGRAHFVAPGELALEDGRPIRARAIVLATGSLASIPPPFRNLGARILTNETIFDLPDLPQSLAVIGGGPVGLELAQAMGRLGVRVTLFDTSTTLGKARCDEVHAALKAAVGRDMTLRLGCETSAEAAAEGIRITWTGGQPGHEVFSHVLVSTGRPPNLRGLDLEASGLKLDDHGTPVFDRQTMQCGDAPVFMAGDADADAPLLHEASDEGAIAGRNAALFPHVAPGSRSTPFTLTFTDPPLATVGAGPAPHEISGRSNYADQGRARIEARNEGVILLRADTQGRLTGADLCCPGAEHLAHLLAWAVQSGVTASGLLEMPFYHPTLEEGLKQALRDICRQTGLPTPDSRDIGSPPGG